MKKGIVLVVFAVVLTTFAFGFDLSAGIGIQSGATFTTTTGKGLNTGEGNIFGSPASYPEVPLPTPRTVDGKSKSAGALFGFDAYFDATYIEVDVGILFGPNGSLDGNSTYFNFGALGKYPIAVGDSVTLFPLLGVDYHLLLSAKDEYGNEWGRSDLVDKGVVVNDNYEKVGSYFDNLWFRLGAGADIDLTNTVYLRNEFLWGFKLKNGAEQDDVDRAKDRTPTMMFLSSPTASPTSWLSASSLGRLRNRNQPRNRPSPRPDHPGPRPSPGKQKPRTTRTLTDKSKNR